MEVSDSKKQENMGSWIEVHISYMYTVWDCIMKNILECILCRISSSPAFIEKYF